MCLPHLTHFTNMIIFGGVHQMSSLCFNDIRVYDIPKPGSALTFSKHRLKPNVKVVLRITRNSGTRK